MLHSTHPLIFHFPLSTIHFVLINIMSEIFGFWARETISNIRRNRLMSLLAVSTVTVGLFVLGSFYLAWGSVQSTVGAQTKKLDLVVILDRNVTVERRKQLYEAARSTNLQKLTFVSKDKALRDMGHELEGIPIDDLRKDNPLGDELHLQLKNPEDIFRVRDFMASLKGVQSIRNPAEDKAVGYLLSINRLVKIAGAIAFVVLGIGILLIIHNAIRLTIFARRREIRIMELVGATSWFIRVPFLMEGLIYGLTGAVYAGGALFFLYAAAVRSGTPVLDLILPVNPMLLMWQCLGWLAVAGVFFGLAGSWLSLSRSMGKAATH